MSIASMENHIMTCRIVCITIAGLLLCGGAHVSCAIGAELPTTTLSNAKIKFRVPEKPYVELRRGPIRAVVVDNRAVDDATLPGHRAGYSGVALLEHNSRPSNLFVPAYAGLNFEHIHDGTVQQRDILFEPRNAPMQLRVIDPHTAELYQPPTPHWGLESATRYRLLNDGAIEMTVECIPRRAAFRNGYIGLFWASYINQPESLDIHFRGHADGQSPARDWIRGVTPSHGVLATHLATDDARDFPHDAQFPMTLVFNRSRHRYSEPWYYGVSHGMALALMFRTTDRIRMSQSPSGGGQGNPAWDFQWFVSPYEVGARYQMVVRALLVPFQSAEQLQRATAPHRRALNPTR
jgi:hypothetical protein